MKGPQNEGCETDLHKGHKPHHECTLGNDGRKHTHSHTLSCNSRHDKCAEHTPGKQIQKASVQRGGWWLLWRAQTPTGKST